jgi:hypothetical protein
MLRTLTKTLELRDTQAADAVQGPVQLVPGDPVAHDAKDLALALFLLVLVQDLEDLAHVTVARVRVLPRGPLAVRRAVGRAPALPALPGARPCTGAGIDAGWTVAPVRPRRVTDEAEELHDWVVLLIQQPRGQHDQMARRRGPRHALKNGARETSRQSAAANVALCVLALAVFCAAAGQLSIATRQAWRMATMPSTPCALRASQSASSSSNMSREARSRRYVAMRSTALRSDVSSTKRACGVTLRFVRVSWSQSANAGVASSPGSV